MKMRSQNIENSLARPFSFLYCCCCCCCCGRFFILATICAHINFVTSENIYTLFIRRYKICGISIQCCCFCCCCCPFPARPYSVYRKYLFLFVSIFANALILMRRRLSILAWLVVFLHSSFFFFFFLSVLLSLFA